MDKWTELTPAWLLLYEEAFLQSLCMTLPINAQCINIGAGAGTSTCAMLRSGAYVASIDIDQEMFKIEAESILRQGLNQNNVTQILRTSEDAAQLFPKETADLVFVDGAHSYENVKKDLELYTQVLKPGGILVCHDYTDPKQRTVTRAVKEWIKDNRDWLQLGQVLYMISFRKPGGEESWRNGRI